MEGQQRKEVQGHGFSWEKELLHNIYGVTDADIKSIRYTSKMDLPAALNTLDHCDLSIKTSCSPNAVCMADCLRIYDAVNSGNPFHMVTVFYTHDDNTNIKRITKIVEVDLTSSGKELFGELTRAEIDSLDKALKAVPQKRKPTEEEYNTMYNLRNQLQPKSNAIHLDIKCNSTQSRLQCSFNRFQKFLSDHPERIIAQSDTCEFRCGRISAEISSSRRVFKKSNVGNNVV